MIGQAEMVIDQVFEEVEYSQEVVEQSPEAVEQVLAIVEHKKSAPAVSFTYEEMKSLKDNHKWNELRNTSVQDALDKWYSMFTEGSLTLKNYRSGINKLVERGYIHREMSLQIFSQINSKAILLCIKKETPPGKEAWSECTRQARAACFISFTNFLCEMTDGMIQKAMPRKVGVDKTFYRFRDEVDTEAMTFVQFTAFLEELEKINTRDCLIAKLTLQGCKRINEVLSVTTDRISWDNSMIHFAQSKTKGAKRNTKITYPRSVMEALKAYIGDRTGLVFVTRNGKKISVDQLENTFSKAGYAAKLPFSKVHPHMLRASAITYLKQLGYSDSEIMKMSGHASAEMVHAYDKSDKADNPSKKVCLVT